MHSERHSSALGELWRNVRPVVLPMLVVAALVAVICCAVGYRSNVQTASARMTLDYAEASQGLTPAGTRYNMYLIQSEPVLERALERAGISNVTPAQLNEMISVEAAYVKYPSSSGSNAFLATDYNVTFTNDGSIKDVDARSMLELLLTSYASLFHERYADKQTVLTPQGQDLTVFEYAEDVTYLRYRAAGAVRYLTERESENRTFTSSTGLTFGAVKEQFQQLMDYDLTNAAAYVEQNAVVRDRAAYMAKLEYQHDNRSLWYQKLVKQYEIYLQAIALYDEGLTSIVMIPTYDANDEYYMSRTQIGIDYLARNAENADTRAKETHLSLERGQALLQAIRTGTTTGEERAAITALLVDINNRLDLLCERARQLDVEYLEYKAKNYIRYTMEEQGLMDQLGVKLAVVVAGVVFVAGCSLAVINRRRKEAKQA